MLGSEALGRLAIGEAPAYVRALQMSVETGTYLASGKPTTILIDRYRSVTPGTYTATGKSVSFAFRMAVDAATYTVEGQAVAKAITFKVQPGAFTMAGVATGFRRFVLTQTQSTSFTEGWSLFGSVGGMALGQIASWSSIATYLQRGQQAGFGRETAGVTPGVYTQTGSVIGVHKGFSLAVTGSAYTANGQVASFTFDRPVLPGSYTMTVGVVQVVRGPLRKVRAFPRVGSVSRRASVSTSGPRSKSTGTYGH